MFINLALLMVLNVGFILILLKFDSDVNQEMSYYIKWAMPFQLVIILAEGSYSIIDCLMKIFDYVGAITLMGIFNEILLIFTAYYLGVVKQMWFKGVMIANLSYIFTLITMKLPWAICILDIKRDIERVDFDGLLDD